MKSISVKGRNISGDEAIGKVIDIQERMEELRRENAALRKDRKDLLHEYTAMRKARPVPKSRPASPDGAACDSVRVCFGDVHGMQQDKAAVGALLRDIKRLSPNVIVIGGDLLECGGWLAKHQPIGFVAACDYSYQEDVNAANAFLTDLQNAAPDATIHYLEGNHEDRVERWVVDQVMANGRDADFLMSLASPRVLLRLEDRGISYYRRSEIYADGYPRGWIRLGEMAFTHSLTYSANAARDAASKTAGNVTYFCTHREDSATIVYPGIGIIKAFNPGCLSKMQPIWKHSNPTSWSQGYGIDFISAGGNFQRVHVPIWKGESQVAAMIQRFKS